MKYITQQGLTLPRLTLGTVQLGLDYGIANQSGRPDERKSRLLLKLAEELGINCFDTAAGYGESEKVLGSYFRKNPRSERTIVSKFRLDKEIDYTQSQLQAAVEAQLERSLQLLGSARLPIYLLHQPNDLHKYGRRLVDVLEKMQARGLIGLAGVSVYTGSDLDKMMQYELFQTCQIPINILDQRLIRSGHLARLAEKNIIVFARSIFLQGLFFKDPAGLPARLTAAAPYLGRLIELARQEKISLAQLAVSFVRDQPGISSLVIGAETLAQVEENVQLCQGPALSADLLENVAASFSDLPEFVLNPALW